MITTAILCIGDELLDGRVRDANACALGRALAERGRALSQARFVPDDRAAILGALEALCADADLVVVSGGLGPTEDDVTRGAAAALIDQELELRPELLEELKARFARRGYPFTENNARQCELPRGAELLATEVGTAAGFALEHRGARVMCVPGVPREFGWFLERYLDEALARQGAPLEATPASTRLHLFGLGESQLAERLAGVEALADELGGRVGYRAEYPRLELSLKAPDDEALARLREASMARAGDWVVGEGDEDLPARIGRLLAQAQARVTAAESCTAGMLAGAITEAAGSSGWFDQSWVTYANRAKMELVGVAPQVLRAHGAVSAQTVCQMAAGAMARAGADYALAVSGIAGPAGGTEDKPVGTVHFALAAPGGIWHRRVHLKGRDRAQVRQASVYIALTLLLWSLEGALEARPVTGPYTPAQVLAPGGLDPELLS